MRRDPAQMGIRLLIEGSLPWMRFSSRAEGMARGRQMLVQVCEKDFGYDVLAWQKHLQRSQAGHRRNLKETVAAISDPEWQQAKAVAESESLFERLIERERKQMEDFDVADRRWANMVRVCPKCSESFKSIRNRGQCPNCGYVFYAK